MPIEEKIKKADFIIENKGTLDALTSNVFNIYLIHCFEEK